MITFVEVLDNNILSVPSNSEEPPRPRRGEPIVQWTGYARRNVWSLKEPSRRNTRGPYSTSSLPGVPSSAALWCLVVDRAQTDHPAVWGALRLLLVGMVASLTRGPICQQRCRVRGFGYGNARVRALSARSGKSADSPVREARKEMTSAVRGSRWSRRAW